MCDKSDPSCIRTEMYSRIKVFRQTGCDAFMTHLLITESNDHTNEDHARGPRGNQSPHYNHHSHPHFQNMKASSPITRSDKQFMLWTMREVLVSCIEVDSVYARGILAWFTWMLRGQLSCNKEKERKDDIHEQRYSESKRPVIDPSSFLANAEPETSSLAPVPASSPIICTYLRLLIIQELRLFLGGDHWEPILPKQVSAMSSKILLVPWVTDIKRGETEGDIGNDDGCHSFIMFVGVT